MRITTLALCLFTLTAGPRLLAADAPATRPAVPKISVDEFDQARKAKDAVVLDVRTPKEYAEGHVPGAINIPILGPGSEEFDQRVAGLDKSKRYLVHCAVGVRSANAVKRLTSAGFTNLADFSGGMKAWKQAQKPVETVEPPAGSK